MPWRNATFSMYPTLHDKVSQLLNEAGLDLSFHNKDTGGGGGAIKTKDSCIMGRFECHNPKCESTGWSSLKIAITIRQYRGQKYNARVYHQRCQRCNWVSRPDLDEGSYAERVTYWLKKWNGVDVKKSPSSGERKGPHDRELCEGCKAGHCPDLERW
ncbi:hypothetical protein FE257_006549 [Aspergillus nanangensis]|uniref:3CxxC-type domain-containing protein n=1 Tax=Aspergillus nanangensis TaxID=2582783 RepID=A0AAD4CXQ2_ASPNN|nr:hypothetical protein FE257_006549 [Aspergillus nanangensis]QGW49102.1 hypothetical protein FE257_006549 [Aspergillus nanangensis]